MEAPRSDAFQEADIRGITFPITKHSFLITKPADIPSAIASAFHIAATGRPGPVLVDISKDARTLALPDPPGTEMFDYVYAAEHPVMSRERQEFAAYQASFEGGH